jgi:hypothetical protein
METMRGLLKGKKRRTYKQTKKWPWKDGRACETATLPTKEKGGYYEKE